VLEKGKKPKGFSPPQKETEADSISPIDQAEGSRGME
jgi:hypothetical protein